MMQNRVNITRMSTGILFVILLVLLQFTAIFAAGSCEGMCTVHNHAQKDMKSCCHSVAPNVSMSLSQVCSVSANGVVEFPVVKTQLTRLSASKILISNSSDHLAASVLPPQYGFYYNYSSAKLKYKETAIYLLDSISLS